jgi:GDP-mannose 6-dehydrogenase
MRVFLTDRKLNVSEALTLPPLTQILPSNDRQIQQGVGRVLATRRRRIAELGLAFKPGPDDLRESPMVFLVEAFIGKGCDVRILDGSVSIARLGGANRRYIEEEIAPIASLTYETPEALLAHAEVLVVGNTDEGAREVLAVARPAQVVIDLGRGGLYR